MPFIPLYEVGDRVIIIDKGSNKDDEPVHDFDIGDVVTIAEVDLSDSDLTYRGQGRGAGDTDWFNEKHCELEESPSKRMATSSNIRTLDIVRSKSDIYLVIRDLKGEVLEPDSYRVIRLKSFNSLAYPEGASRTMNAKLMDTYEIVANLQDIAGELYELF